MTQWSFFPFTSKAIQQVIKNTFLLFHYVYQERNWRIVFDASAKIYDILLYPILPWHDLPYIRFRLREIKPLIGKKCFHKFNNLQMIIISYDLQVLKCVAHNTLTLLKFLFSSNLYNISIRKIIAYPVLIGRNAASFLKLQ